ncbi:MAG: VOC family protein [candidate division Zixibacteria bacterium]|nr:VOC family protein [candidate division Zixibacteria bacterium]
MPDSPPKRVTGIGGIFFKANDPKRLFEWYRTHLGIAPDPRDEPDWTGFTFRWRDPDNPERVGSTVWSIFPRSSRYFGSGDQPYMINYRVDNLDGLLAELRREGVTIGDHVEESEYGKFGWITDPEGNRVELWQPPVGKQRVIAWP